MQYVKFNYTLVAKQEETNFELERSELGQITREDAVNKALEVAKQWVDAYTPTTIAITLVEGDGLGKRENHEFKYNPHENRIINI